MGKPVLAPQTYARWRATTLGSITELVETTLVFDLAGDVEGKRVLDVGRGDGTYAIEAAARGARVTAVDIESGMLDAARARAAARGVELFLERGRPEALPFGDASFDVVLAVTVLCFVPDANAALREMARVLAPGGRLVLGELGRFSLWAAERRVRGWLGARTWSRARFWSRAQLGALARRPGLRVDQTRGAVFFPPSGLAARLLGPLDPLLTRLQVPGAAFLALTATKPESMP
ncbi:MAG: class I SAM-dependent methyltransferase [Deltaproteobacteria bacterium]|nr:class I SAM-dependent methyltransferase [Deltaproteobacteria bacterium]